MKLLQLACCVLSLPLGSALRAQETRPTTRKAPPEAVGEVAKDAGRLVKLLELDRQAEEASQALVRLGKQALPPLIVALDDPRMKVRVRAVRVLGSMGSDARSALPWLRKFAKDENGHLAFPAFEALTRIQNSGRMLVADYSENRIFEVDDAGKETFAIKEIFGVWDVERLPNGNLLLTEFSVNRVREMTPEGKVVWTYGNLKNPYDADRLPNGNTLIADTFGRRVIEVDKKGAEVWKFDTHVQPYDADRLPNGNTLISDGNLDRIIEVDKKGKIVWRINNMSNVHDADRLPNGNTVVAENGMVREFDKDGKQVRKIVTRWAVEVSRY